MSGTGSLCTMFAFAGVDDPNILHCTHKYFGDEYTGGEEKVIKELQSYFSAKPFKPFSVKFDQLKQMGEEGDYRALTTDERDAFHPELKQRLDAIHPDKWPEYLPHVTVGRNTDSLEKPIRDYVLMKDHVPIWSASQHQAKMSARLAAMEDEYTSKGQTMSDFNSAIDAAIDEVKGKPQQKTPEELLQNPLELLDDEQKPITNVDQGSEGQGGRPWGTVG